MRELPAIARSRHSEDPSEYRIRVRVRVRVTAQLAGAICGVTCPLQFLTAVSRGTQHKFKEALLKIYALTVCDWFPAHG